MINRVSCAGSAGSQIHKEQGVTDKSVNNPVKMKLCARVAITTLSYPCR